MVDFKINIERSPVQNNAPPAVKSEIKNPVSETNSLPRRAKWNGVDRRRHLTERRGSKQKRPLVELRQRADRRRNASVNIKV